MNTSNGLKPNPIVPIGSDDPEPLFVIREKMLYLHQDLLKGMHEFFPPSTDFTLCGQQITINWGKQSAIYPKYRGNSLPKTESNYAIEDAKWLQSIYLGEVAKRETITITSKLPEKAYLSMMIVKDYDYQILKETNNPQETILKIKHSTPFIQVKTYKVFDQDHEKLPFE